MNRHDRSRVIPGTLTRRTVRRTLLRAAGGSVFAAGLLTTGRQSSRAQAPPLATPNALGPAIPPELTEHADDWPTPQGNLAAHRAASASPIAAANVDRLEVAWRFPLAVNGGGYGAVTAIPLVVGESVYLQDMESNVFALDRESGALIWEHDYGIPTAGPNGVAAGYGLVFGSTGAIPEAFALDAGMGDEVWRVKLSANHGEFIFMQPLVYNNVVYLATSPSAYIGGTRGILFALDAKSGAVLWQWDTTDDNLWGSARLNAGGGVWYPPSVDDGGNIYFGTGNPAPWPEIGISEEESTRPGPNLYSSSMVSLDPATGSLRWYVQAKPHDPIDHDFQHTPVLATVTIAGQPTPLAIGAGKTGTVIAANADTGEVVWKTSVGEHNANGETTTLPAPSATPVAVLPGPYGGVLTPIAFAHETVYVPVINLPLSYSDASFEVDLAAATGEMVALNAADGTVRWRIALETFFAGGATVANDVVFGAGLDGIVRGFSTARGEEIWSYQTGAGINAPPAIAGDLLLVPAGGALISDLEPPPPLQNELIAFRLRGDTA